MLNTAALNQGTTYRVVYRSETQQLPREMVGTFLQEYEGSLIFNLRPAAGTVNVPVGWVREIWETSRRHSAPTVYRGERRLF